MLSSKRLLEIARKWKKMAALGRKAISWTGRHSDTESVIADKGHFIVYTSEGKRFMVPLSFLQSSIFLEILRLSEEEFGLPGDGPITLPCDAEFLEFMLSMLRRRVSKEFQNEMLMSVITKHCSRSLLHDVEHCQRLTVF